MTIIDARDEDGEPNCTFPDIPAGHLLSLFGNKAVIRKERLFRVVLLDISTTFAGYMVSGQASNRIPTSLILPV